MLLEGHRFSEAPSSVLPCTEILLTGENWKGIERCRGITDYININILSWSGLNALLRFWGPPAFPLSPGSDWDLALFRFLGGRRAFPLIPVTFNVAANFSALRNTRSDAGSGGSKCTFFPGGFSGGEGDSEFDAINRRDGRIGDVCLDSPGEEGLLSECWRMYGFAGLQVIHHHLGLLHLGQYKDPEMAKLQRHGIAPLQPMACL
jgi:hypothetical protein